MTQRSRLRPLAIAGALLAGLASTAHADSVTGLITPTAWGSNPNYGAWQNAFSVALKTPQAALNRCASGTVFQGVITVPLVNESAKAMYATLLAASIANRPVTLAYTYTLSTNSCTLDGVGVP